MKIARALRAVAAAASAVCLTGTLVAAAPAASAAWPDTDWPVDDPVATGRANPGVIRHGDRWVMATTGGWNARGNISVADKAAGPWRRTGTRLLTRKAAWMSDIKGVWAPSIARSTDGTFVLYFAGALRGASGDRCIGSATADRAIGPYTPQDRALACYRGSGANPRDAIRREAAPGRKFTLIDPTPTRVGGQLVLTYKTGRYFADDPQWGTATRMVKLDPARPWRLLPNPRRDDGGSVVLTRIRNHYIEENPVIVERGGRFTLFTSFGFYGQCRYVTRYRQNGSLWGRSWLDRRPRDLPFPASVNTCGRGNAHVVRGERAGTWRILFNGHPERETAGGPDGLYVGAVGWRDGRPRVTGLLRP